MSISGYDQLITRLDAFIRKYYKNQLVKGAIYSVGLSLLFFLAVSVMEYFGRFGTTIRTILFYSFIGGNLAIWIKFIFIPLSKLYRFGKVISYEQAARIIGEHFADVKDKLLNILQLREMLSQSGSDLLLASIEQKTVELRPVAFSKAINIGDNRKYLKYLVIPFSIFIFILFAAPSIITDSTRRIVSHGTYFAPEAPFSFSLINQDLTAIEYEDYQLEVKMDGREVPKSVYIEMDGNQFKLDRDQKGTFTYLFKSPQKNISFRLFADGFYSDSYTLKVVSKPMVTGVNILLEFPAYLGMKNEELKNLGDLTIPQGTRVTWNLNTRSVETLKFKVGDSTMYVNPKKNAFSHTQRLLENTPYSIKAFNTEVYPKDSIAHNIRIIPDLYPSIEVAELKDSILATRLFFKGDIKDDYGFKKLSFFYKVQHAGEENPRYEYINLPVNSGQTQQMFYHFLDASDMNLKAGDEVVYFFEVWDNDGVRGSKSVKTAMRSFKLPTKDEVRDMTDKNNENTKSDLTQSLEKAQDIQKSINELNKNLLQKKDVTWQDKEKLQKLLEEQQKLQEKISEMKKENEKNNEQRNQLSPQEQKILEKQEQLQKLFDELQNEELKKLMEEMQKMMDKMDKNKLKEMLEKLQLNNEDLEKELDRTLEIFKEMDFQQKLQDVIEQLDELQKEQEKLAEESKNKDGNSEEQQKKQDELKDKFEQIKDDIRELEKKNEDLQQKHDMENTQPMEEDIQNEMQKASQQLQQKQNSKASQSQQNAGQKMQKMKEQMQSMQMDMEMQQKQENLEDLRQILDNLLKLSFDQENVMQQLKNVNRHNPQFKDLVKEQKKLKDDSRIIEDSLLALSKRMPELESFVNKEISTVKFSMEKALSHLEEMQYPMATNRQQYALTSINNLALMLSEAIEQMQQQLQMMSSMGSSSCNKPGQAKPNMQGLMQKQGAMQQKMEELQKKMGPQPGGGKSGQQGEGDNITKELVQMAAEQEAIRKELQKLSEQLGKEGKQALNDIMKKMEENETDLLNKRITNETLKRQKDITVRMLESEKSLREQETDNKRQSNEGKEKTADNIPALEEYFKQKKNELELIRTMPPSLRPYYRNKVSEYFNKF